MILGVQILRGERSGDTVALDPDRGAVVGSDETVDLPLSGLDLLAVQFTLRCTDGQWTLVHGGGDPPTLVNRQLVDECPIRAGDLIQAGRGLFALVALPDSPPERNPLQDTSPTYRDKRFFDGALSATDGGQTLAALTTLNRLGYEMHAERGMAPLLARVLDVALELVPTAERAVALRDERREVRVVASRVVHDSVGADQVRVSRTIAEQSIRNGMSTISADASADRRFSKATSVREALLRSVLCVPLVGRGRNLGALYLDASRPDAFIGADLEWIGLLGMQAGIALDRTMLETSLRQREEQARELATALARQKSYLETVLAETRDAMLLLDQHGRPLLANRAFRELLGQPAAGASPQELLGLLETMRPHPADAFRQALGVGEHVDRQLEDLPCDTSWPAERALALSATTVLTEGGHLGRLVVVRDR